MSSVPAAASTSPTMATSPLSPCEDSCNGCCGDEADAPVTTATVVVDVPGTGCHDGCCDEVELDDAANVVSELAASPAISDAPAGACVDACCSSKKAIEQSTAITVCHATEYPSCCVEAVCRALTAPACCSPAVHIAPSADSGTTATKPTQRVDKRNWRHAALAVSLATIVWNIVEGSLGLVYGAEAVSVALLGFGADSWVEVLSAIAVTYRFWQLETSRSVSTAKERRATLVIGGLLLVLAVCIVGGSVSALALHERPDSDIASIAISATAIGVMAVLYVVKMHVALALSSSALQSDAQCSLCCIQLSTVLLVGSLVTHYAGDVVWWFDGATALAIALLVGREGVNAVRNARRPDFSGCGCCDEDSGWYIQWLRKQRRVQQR